MMTAARFFGFFLLLALGGCFVWSTADDPSKQSPGDVDPVKTVPDRPPLETSSDDDDGVMHFAGYGVEMIQSKERWPESGLNLDGVNTTGPDAPRACEPRGTTSPAIDGIDGIDNQYGAKVSPLLAVPLPTAVCEMTGSHFNGKGTFVAGVEKWNGQPNDAKITAWIIAAAGAIPTPDGNEPEGEITWVEGDTGFDIHLDGEPVPPPCFDGNDVFYINSHDSLLTPAIGEEERFPRIVDTNAYIVDNVIVARVPAAHPLTLMSVYRSLPARINDGYIVARVSSDYMHIEDGKMAGRFHADSILDVAREIGACDMNTLNTFRTTITDGADLMYDPQRDHQSELCDAISVGIPLKAVRAKVATTLGRAWAPDVHCDLVEEWIDAGESGKRYIYDCFGAASRYNFADQWDQTKNPGLMDHCTNGTLIPGILD
jgi:hypothetical protein